MLKKINEYSEIPSVKIANAVSMSPFNIGLEYSSPARGTWNIVHTGMLIPQAHEIFVCAAGCLRGVVLTAAEMGAQERFSTVAVRESNLLDGNMEELIIDGVTDIINKLPKRPPAVLVYTSCVHHFSGCDLNMVYDVLKKRFPDIDITDCYMNPIMRKSGLDPDQIMRRQLYSLLDEMPKDKKGIAIIGNDLKSDENNDLCRIIRDNGFTKYEIQTCKTYSEYKQMAKASIFITSTLAARPGGEALVNKIGGTHLYLPFSLNYTEIENNLTELCKAMCVEAPDFSKEKEKCEAALEAAHKLIGDKPIAIDGTYVTRPLGLAKLLLIHGFNVKRVYSDAFIGEEKDDFIYLKKNFGSLELFPVTHASMRFAAEKEKSDYLALGQKAAYFTDTDNFVNVIENGGMYGFEAIERIAADMSQAFLEKKDMRNLIQIKGMGCSCAL